jgi:hypothetical protein
MNATTTRTTTTPTACWCGWWRESKSAPWQKLVDAAASYGDAWGQLLDAAPPSRLGEMQVLTEGVQPIGAQARGT